MKNRIHIIGGSGSGTSSLGKAVCDKIGYKHFDSDNYLWLRTKDPYTEMRSEEEYISLMGKDLTNNDKWILSGHVSFGLGNVYMPLYELVVFIYVHRIYEWNVSKSESMKDMEIESFLMGIDMKM